MKTLLASLLLLTVSALSAEIPISPAQAVEFGATILPYEVDNKFHKWESSPSITCVGQAAKFKPLVEDFIRDVGGVLNGLPVQPTLAPDNDPKADIQLVIDTPKALEEYKRKEGAMKDWQWRAQWTPDGALKRFVLFNDISHYYTTTGTNERRLIYASLLKGLGISGSKAYPINSIWGRFSQGTPESALWENDKRLIRFAYETVPNNSTRETVKRVIKKEWK